MTYRTPFVPETDDEIEALAELGQVTRRLKLWTVIPLVPLTAAAMVASVWLHVAGGLALFAFADGSYVVSKGSICVVAGLSGLLTFVPGWVLGSLIQVAAVKHWRRGARRRFNLDSETLQSLERMFA